MGRIGRWLGRRGAVDVAPKVGSGPPVDDEPGEAARAGMTSGASGVPPEDLPDRLLEQHPRYRAIRRRIVRDTLSLVAILVGAVALPLGAGMVLLLPAGRSAFAAEAIVVAAAIGAAVLARGPARHRPEAAAFGLGLVMSGTGMAIIRISPEAETVMVAGLAILPVAMALYIPWSGRAHLIWLFLAVATIFVAGLVPGLPPIEPHYVVEVLAGVGLGDAVSIVGFQVSRRQRLTTFRLALRTRSLLLRARNQQTELDRLNQELAASSRRDPLTGAANRLRLTEDLPVIWGDVTRYRRGYVAVMMDIDHFKRYNDRHGHAGGDEALRAVARALLEETRAGDIAYRYGGEEFLVILREQTPVGGRVAAERLRTAVAELAIPAPENQPWGVVTISAGVAIAEPDRDGTVDDWLRRADRALFRAKNEGRNRVVVDAAPPPSRTTPERDPASPESSESPRTSQRHRADGGAVGGRRRLGPPRPSEGT